MYALFVRLSYRLKFLYEAYYSCIMNLELQSLHSFTSKCVYLSLRYAIGDLGWISSSWKFSSPWIFFTIAPKFLLTLVCPVADRVVWDIIRVCPLILYEISERVGSHMSRNSGINMIVLLTKLRKRHILGPFSTVWCVRHENRMARLDCSRVTVMEKELLTENLLLRANWDIKILKQLQCVLTRVPILER